MLRAFARPPGAIAASATRDATREDGAKFANQKARATVGRKPRAPRARARDDDDRAVARDWADVDARGFGRGSSALDRARYVVRDAKARLALPSSDGGVVGERPFSDVVYGCAFCAATTYALGAVDCWMRANAMARAPFMIGAWASLSVLAFGVVDAPPLRWWNLIVATTCSALIGVLSVRAFGANHVARAVALGASLAVMMRLGAIHPPAGAGGVRGGGIARVRGFGMVVRRLSRAHRRRVHRVRGQGVRVGQVESRVRVRGRRACIFECIFVVLASSRRSVGLKLF